VLLKGIVLARVLYREDEYRGYFDVDVLVDPVHVATAGDVLSGMGYRNFSEAQGIDDVAGVLHAEVWTKYEPDFGNVTIDLHWRLDGCGVDPELAWRTLMAHTTTIDVAGAPVLVLDTAGLALHLALHAAQHGPEDLKAMGDLSRGLERWPLSIWTSAAELAAQLGAKDAFAVGLRFVPAGIPVAKQLGLPLGDALLREINCREFRPRGTFHWQAFVQARGVRARANVLKRSLLPRREWIIAERPWASRGQLSLLVAYGLHLLRAPAWALSALRYRRQGRKPADDATD
jgi:hypothetical protein